MKNSKRASLSLAAQNALERHGEPGATISETIIKMAGVINGLQGSRTSAQPAAQPPPEPSQPSFDIAALDSLI
jgi:hypothetical protein